ncbi:MAG: saccharopine dehydrogenase NADP-binding domain-containing protein [Ignavibacterium sp.]|nr:MAG: saccharopine dehydrogenase NADP-binding domain-containing protein [Ignavibacterium sp.]
MKKVLVLGAGRTATSLISYLSKQAEKQNWQITVADQSLELAQQKTAGLPRANAISFDVFDVYQRGKEISKADVVVSLLPEDLHFHLVEDCLENKVHLVTASYVSDEMRSYHESAIESHVILLNEMGLDPGIDHMETMRLITRIKDKGGKILSLRSFGGGLITPESDDNPWGYKITWNPMNVVIAGMASARYVKDGKLKIVPYNRLFLDTEIVDVEGVGKYEAYPNRDSIKYRKIYHLPKLPNVYRGSLRKKGFCKAWNALVKIGLTDNRYIVPESQGLTYEDWLSIYLTHRNGETTKEALKDFLNVSNNSDIIQKIEWLGLFSNKRVRLKNATPADILLDLLKQKWVFKKTDRDMVILQTEIEYQLNGQKEKIISSFVLKGEDSEHTAMSKTVGLPLGIAANLILNNHIKERGVIIPIHRDIFRPALKELSNLGITPTERVTEI